VDVVLGFEPLEALRVLVDYGRETTRIVVNPRAVYPLAVQVGEATYPDVATLLATIGRVGAGVLCVEGTDLARRAGDVKAQNIVMLGALAGSGWLPVDAATFDGVLAERFGDELLRLNREAFRLGLEASAAMASPPAPAARA
jgi:indolepyruvate ferredoxin oxidoreductase beta subunit